MTVELKKGPCPTMTLTTENTQAAGKRTSTFDGERTLRRMPNLNGGAVEDQRAEIALYFTNTFDTYTQLFDCLVDDAVFYQKPIPR